MVLLDRCVPPGVGAALNHFEIDFRTLADVYGDDGAQRVADVEWIRDSAAQGWLALTQNFKIPRVAHEAAAIREHSARILCYSKANLTREAKGLILGRHLRTLKQLGEQSTAAFWRMSPQKVHRDI